MRFSPTSVLIAWLLIFTDPVTAAELTIVQADTLARLAFEHQVRHSKNRGGYSLDPSPADFDARFFHFEVLGVWGGAGPGSAVLGRFAVNRQSGEVWDTYGECKRVNFPALHAMQRDYRQRYELPARIPDPVFRRDYAEDAPDVELPEAVARSPPPAITKTS